MAKKVSDPFGFVGAINTKKINSMSKSDLNKVTKALGIKGKPKARHNRTSKKGKVFSAGKGGTKVRKKKIDMDRANDLSVLIVDAMDRADSPEGRHLKYAEYANIADWDEELKKLVGDTKAKAMVKDTIEFKRNWSDI